MLPTLLTLSACGNVALAESRVIAVEKLRFQFGYSEQGGLGAAQHGQQSY
jgi:hypothetical protein